MNKFLIISVGNLPDDLKIVKLKIVSWLNFLNNIIYKKLG